MYVYTHIHEQGDKSARLRKAETQNQLQQQEINSLEEEVNELRETILQKHPHESNVDARLESLAQQGSRGSKGSVAQVCQCLFIVGLFYVFPYY